MKMPLTTFLTVKVLVNRYMKTANEIRKKVATTVCPRDGL